MSMWEPIFNEYIKTTVLTSFEMLKMTIKPKLKDYWNFLAVGSFVTSLRKIEKKTVSKKKKKSEAHYQQIWEILESRIDGQGERFTHSKHCS